MLFDDYFRLICGKENLQSGTKYLEQNRENQ